MTNDTTVHTVCDFVAVVTWNRGRSRGPGRTGEAAKREERGVKTEMNNMFNLMQGDCLELMKGIPAGSVDAIITDPPYNISRDNNFHTMGRAGIDFGDWEKLKSSAISTKIRNYWRKNNENHSGHE